MNPSKTADFAEALNPAANRGQEATSGAPRTQASGDSPRKTPGQLSAAMEQKITELVKEYELEADTVRRHHVRRLLKAEQYWKGNQHLIWSNRQFKWYTPFEKAIQDAPNANNKTPRYQYVNNVYRAWGLSIMAAVSQKVPKTQFLPKSSKAERDIATARAASDVMDIIERNNEIELLSIRCAYLMWTQGLIGAYVRYVVDPDFGEHQEPVIEDQTIQIADDRYVCENCGDETSENDLAGGLAGDHGLACPGCGYPLGDADFHPAEHDTVPVVSGFKTYPDGQERITLYGALSLKMMPTAESLKQTLYLILAEEQHQAALRARYPLKFDAIAANTSASATDATEKTGRMGLTDAAGSGSGGDGTAARTGAQPFAKMVTFRRAWLRPEAFYNVEEEDVRTALLTQYPKGLFVAMADQVFLEARPENMDDHWAVCRPMPGNGMYTDAVGADAIPIQEQINDARNVAAEHIEFGSSPPVFYDGRFIKGSSIEKRRNQPGAWYPIHPEGASGAVTMDKMIHQPKIEIDSNIYSYGRELIEFGQTITGAMPTIFGAPLKGNDTASGYSMAREQALGKLGLFWTAVKTFWARVALLSVQCFAENRDEDYELVVEERSKEYKSTYIHLEDLKGNVTAHPDPDEDFPTTWAQIRENIEGLMQNAPAIAQRFLMHPANAPMLKKFIGYPDLVSPDEDNREKQYREIDQLIEPGQEAIPTPDGLATSTVQPDLGIDDHDSHILTAQEWGVSDKGIECKKNNPAGYSNVMAHILDHKRAKLQEAVIMEKLQQAAQMAAAPPPPPPPPGAPDAASSGAPAADKGGQTVGDMVEKAIPGAGAAVQKLASAKVA